MKKSPCQFCGKKHRKNSRIGTKHSSSLCQRCPYKECFNEEYIPNLGWGYGGHSIGNHGLCLTFRRFVNGEVSLEEALKIKEYTGNRHAQGIRSKSHDYEDDYL